MGPGMKTILIPTEDHDAMPAVLEAARLVARQFDSYMEGFAVRPSAGTYVTVEPVSSLAISGAFEGDTANQARAEFETFMKKIMACRKPTRSRPLFLTAGRGPRRRKTPSSAATAAVSI